MKTAAIPSIMGGASRESISVVLSLMDTAPSAVLLICPSLGCLVPVLVHQCLATLPFLCTPAPDLHLVQDTLYPKAVSFWSAEWLLCPFLYCDPGQTCQMPAAD